MNKIIIILLLTLVGCVNQKVKVKGDLSKTTVELQQLASQDTILYKVVLKDDRIYCINGTTNLVEYKMTDHMSTTLFFFLGVDNCNGINYVY